MPLDEYRRKRDFGATPEPAPGELVDSGGRFTIQRHRATGGAEGLPARRLGRCLRVPRVVIFGMLGLEPGGAGPGGDRGAA